MAASVLTLHSHGYDSVATVYPSEDPGLYPDAGIEGTLSQSPTSLIDCMPIVAESLQEEGISAKPARLAAGGRRRYT